LPDRTVTGAKEKGDENTTGYDLYIKISRVRVDYANYHLYLSIHFIDPKTIEQFISNFDSVMTDLNEELAVAIQNTKAPVDKGKPQEEKPAEPAQEYADEMYATPEEAARAVHPEADTSDEPKTLPFPLEQPKPSYEDLVAEVTKLREELKKVRRPWG
jgi:hypothetical protein